jgi:hypothetical protein
MIGAKRKYQTAEPSRRPLDPSPAIIPNRGRIQAPAGPSGGRFLLPDCAQGVHVQLARASNGQSMFALPPKAGIGACGWIFQ